MPRAAIIMVPLVEWRDRKRLAKDGFGWWLNYEEKRLRRSLLGRFKAAGTGTLLQSRCGDCRRRRALFKEYDEAFAGLMWWFICGHHALFPMQRRRGYLPTR